MNEYLKILLTNVDLIIMALVVVFILTRLTREQLFEFVKIAVKAAEKTFIDTEGKSDRVKTMQAILEILIGKKRAILYSLIIQNMAKAVILDLPPTTPRIKAKKAETEKPTIKAAAAAVPVPATIKPVVKKSLPAQPVNTTTNKK